MGATVEVRKPDGTTNDPMPLVRLERSRKFNEMDSARVYVPAIDARAQTINEDDDEILVEDDSGTRRWGGVLTEAKQKADRFELICDGFERYARDAEPSQGTESYASADDSTIVSDAVGNVPQLSAGTITTQQTGITVDFYYASQALKIRQMRDTTGSYVRYDFNKNVHYTSTLGTDKTGGQTLSPNNLSFTEFRKRRSEPEPRPTHIRVIGFDGTFADVTWSGYSAGDREIWRRAYYNDIANQSVLSDTGTNLIEELGPATTRLEARVIGDAGITPELGDKYHVKYPEYDVDINITVAEVTEILDREGTHYEVVFSTKDLTYERAEEFDSTSKLKRRFGASGVGSGGGSATREGTWSPVQGVPTSRSFTLGTVPHFWSGLWFKPDGTKLYYTGNSSTIESYSLSTAWDITTASATNSFSTSSQYAQAQIGDGGSGMYAVEYSGTVIQEWRLGTDWDISTASTHNTLDTTSNLTDPNGLFITDDGRNLYVGDYGLQEIHGYTAGSGLAWEIEDFSYDQLAVDVTGEIDSPGSFMYSGPDLTQPRFLGVTTSSGVAQYDWPNDPGYEYDVIPRGVFDHTNELTSPYAYYMKPDGKRFWIMGTIPASDQYGLQEYYCGKEVVEL